MIFIYALRCPLSGQIRYIGKTKNLATRMWQHLYDAKAGKTHRACWVRKLLSLGLSPAMETLCKLDDTDNWQEAEIRYIAEHRAAGHSLTNMTTGGEGIDEMPPESVERQRAGLLKAWADPIARQRRLATLRQIVMLASERPEVRARNSAAQKVVWANKDVAALAALSEKTAASMKSLWSDPEVKAARLETLHSPEAKAKRYGNRDTPEKTAARVEKLKAAWADPVRRASRIAKMQTPEYKAKVAANSLAMHARRRAAKLAAP